MGKEGEWGIIKKVKMAQVMIVEHFGHAIIDWFDGEPVGTDNDADITKAGAPSMSLA